MICRVTSAPVLCTALVFGCASAGNGQAAEPVDERQSQATQEREVSESVLDVSEKEAEPEAASSAERDKAMADCEECNGKWGKHGLAQVEGCICRTSDFGKPCDDGDDCEGVCLQKGDDFKCSEFVTVFGCYSYLPKGWSKRGDNDKPPVPRICLD